MGKTPLALHGRDHRMGGADPIPIVANYEIKVFADIGALDGTLPDTSTHVSTGDGKFVFAIPEDIDQTSLVHAHAFVSGAGSGDIVVQIHNITQAVDMLSTSITIDSGDFTSYTSATPPVINTANDLVATSDLIRIDVDNDGTGDGTGLGVILMFT